MEQITYGDAATVLEAWIHAIKKEEAKKIMATQKIIAAGDISEEAEAWLKEHGAKFHDHFGVSLIELPEKAEVARGAYDWQYSISFGEDENGNYLPYCEIELYANVNDTRITLKQ